MREDIYVYGFTDAEMDVIKQVFRLAQAYGEDAVKRGVVSQANMDMVNDSFDALLRGINRQRKAGLTASDLTVIAKEFATLPDA